MSELAQPPARPVENDSYRDRGIEFGDHRRNNIDHLQYVARFNFAIRVIERLHLTSVRK